MHFIKGKFAQTDAGTVRSLKIAKSKLKTLVKTYYYTTKRYIGPFFSNSVMKESNSNKLGVPF